MTIKSYLQASIDYIDDTTRQIISNPSDFVAIKQAITQAKIAVNDNPKNGKQIINDLLTTAIDNNAPLAFFKQISEIRSQGTLEEIAQTQIVARIGLAYYFEKISEGANYQQLQEFREHAQSIKDNASETIEQINKEQIKFSGICRQANKNKLINDQINIINATDKLIVFASQGLNKQAPIELTGNYHALVASYHLYGNISQASDIVKWSNSTSGANIHNPIFYPQDT